MALPPRGKPRGFRAMKIYDLWRCYRLACERLKREKLLYQTGTGAYANKDIRFCVLVENVESIVASTNTDWSTITERVPQSPTGS